MYVDATAAIEVAQRVGLGKLRHLETQSLWLQEAVRDKRVGLSKVHGSVNPADLMTKHVDHATQIRLPSLMGVEARMGRAESAPETGDVDEKVCSVESTGEGREEPERRVIELNETEIDTSIDRWLYESVIGFSRGRYPLGPRDRHRSPYRRRLRPAAAPACADRQNPMHSGRGYEQRPYLCDDPIMPDLRQPRVVYPMHRETGDEQGGRH